MSGFVTTNIRLPEDLYMELKMKAARERKSMSAVIREKLVTKRDLRRGKKETDNYKMRLLSIKGVWNLEPEIKRNRKQIEKRLERIWNE